MAAAPAAPGALSVWVAPAVACAVACAVPGAGRARGVLVCFAALCAGVAIDRGDRERQGTPPSLVVEAHFVGELSAPPERLSDGSRDLFLVGALDGAAAPGATFRCRLRVRPTRGEDGDDPLSGLWSGQRLRVWARIRPPIAAGNPGASDPATWMRAQGLEALGSVKDARLVERVEPRPRGVRARLDELRDAARRRLERRVPAGDARSVLAAMLLGERGGITPDLRLRLRDAGLLHLTAISGLHVGLLLWTAHEALRRLGCRPAGARFVVLAPLVAAFAVAVGSRAPVLRAAVTATLVLGGRSLGREADARSGLALAAVLLVIRRPGSLHDPGFQLSFLATLAILELAPRIASALPAGPFASVASISIAAYAGTAPIVALHFGHVSPVGVVSNLLAAPLCAASLLAGALTVLVGDVPGIGAACSGCSHLAARLLVALADAAAGVEAGSFPVSAPSRSTVTLCYATLLLALVVRRHRTAALAAAVAAAVSMTWVHVGPPPCAPDGRLRAAVPDVGQGQAVAVRGGDGRCLVVDAGGSPAPTFDPGERIVLPWLTAWSCRRLDGIVVSHEHADHAGGVAALLRELDVTTLWLPPGWSHHERLAGLAAAARRHGAAVGLAHEGRRLDIGDTPVRVLAPQPGDVGRDPNERSIVLSIGRAPARLLVPGDLEGTGEADLLRRVGEGTLRAEALVLGHHGARRSTGGSLLRRVRPEIAIASAGRGNRFGHPAPDTVARLARLHVPLLRTDVDGLVVLEEDEAGWRARCGPRMVPCEPLRAGEVQRHDHERQ